MSNKTEVSDYTIETKFKQLVERHFVRTCELLLAKFRTYTDATHPSTISVCLEGRKKFNVDFEWCQSLAERMDTLGSLGGCVSDLLLVDFKEAISTASEVTLTLWSALRAQWGFNQVFSEYDKENMNLHGLLDSALWYVPMCGKEQQFIPYLKYQLSYLFAKGERQAELPVRPGWMLHNDGLVLGGSLGRAFYIRCLGLKRSSQEWRNTVLHGIKKGLPQMGPYHLLKNIKSMKERLTRKTKTPSCLRDEIARTAREVYPKGLVYEDWAGADLYVKVSDHACWERSRSGRGTLGALRSYDQNPLDSSLSGSVNSSYLNFDGLLGMYYDPHTAAVTELRIPSWTPESIYNQFQRFSSLGNPGDTVEKVGLYPAWNLERLEETGRAKVKPIFEPLKVRMISAGDIFSNSLFAKLQQKLWSSLQRFPAFALTGRTVTTQDIEGIARLTTNLAIPGTPMKLWVSGDYSAATDNMNGDATKAAVDAIAGDEITRKVLLRGLQNTLISFESIKETFVKDGDLKSADEVPDPFVMTNGQLMGCVFSFPLLCIVNIATYRASLEAYSGQQYSLGELPVLTNGDDILFQTNAEHLAIWEGLLPKVGFEKSVGKNYVSPNFCVINSQYFDTTDYRKVPYFNLGWCTGVTKGSGGRFEAGEDGEEKTILGLKPKVERTVSDWLESPEFVEGLTPKQLVSRKERVSRFKEEILRWNWSRIRETSVSTATGPAGLGLTESSDLKELAWTYFLDMNREDRNVSHGLDSVPRTMVPWKLTKSDNTFTRFWAERTLFERYWKRSTTPRLVSKLGCAKIFVKTEEELLEEQMGKYFTKLLDRLDTDLVWKPRYSVGALI